MWGRVQSRHPCICIFSRAVLITDYGGRGPSVRYHQEDNFLPHDVPNFPRTKLPRMCIRNLGILEERFWGKRHVFPDVSRAKRKVRCQRGSGNNISAFLTPFEHATTIERQHGEVNWCVWID